MQLGKKLSSEKIDLVFSSPLRRARQTAENILKTANLNLEIIIDDRLKEIDAGKMDGKSIEEWYQQFTPGKRFNENPHQGESEAMCEERVLSFIHEIKKKYPHKNILVVTHGAVLNLFEKYFYLLNEEEVFTLNNPPSKV